MSTSAAVWLAVSEVSAAKGGLGEQPAQLSKIHHQCLQGPPKKNDCCHAKVTKVLLRHGNTSEGYHLLGQPGK
jgi:hypothetical protein